MSTKIKRYAVLTPFDKPEVVAGILALQHIDVFIVPTQSGALVVRELPTPQYDEWDIRNIVGPDELDENEDVDASDNAPAVAAILSRLSRFGVVLIDVDLGSDVGIEAGVSGIVRARRFLGGEPGDEISAGLLLNSVDPLIEKIVLGHEAPADHDAIASSEVTTSMITRLARKKGKGKAGPSGKKRQSALSGKAEDSGRSGTGDSDRSGKAGQEDSGRDDGQVSEGDSRGSSDGPGESSSAPGEAPGAPGESSGASGGAPGSSSEDSSASDQERDSAEGGK